MNKQEALMKYCLRIGDSALIVGHRLSELCGHGPILEEDLGIINTGLDCVGQSTTMLKYAAEIEGKGRNEDDLAFFRNEREFLNNLLVEQQNGDYAHTIARQFFFDLFNVYLYDALKASKDATIAAFADKSLKEVTYHLRHSEEWMYRLGDGTEESRKRMQAAVEDLWMFTGDMFEMDEVDALLISEGVAVDLKDIQNKWNKKVDAVLEKATLTKPINTFMQTGSKKGIHSEHLGYLLAEMQSLARAYPGAKW